MNPKLRNLSGRAEQFQLKPLEDSHELGRGKPIDPASHRGTGNGPADAGRPDAAVNTVFGPDEAKTVEALRSGQLQTATLGKTSRTLAFKVTLDSGVLGYYKPEQRLAGTSWAAELAAYRIDRALGLGRVPPAVSRRFPWKDLEAAAAEDARSKTVRVQKGEVRGALIAWLEQPLAPAATPHGWEDWIRIEAFDPFAVSPFQPADAYAAELADHKKRNIGQKPTPVGTRPERKPSRPGLDAELSDLILFDYLIGNADRFTPDNANVLLLGKKGPLIAVENGSAFVATGARLALLNAQLGAVQKFRRRTVEAIRALDIGALKATLAADPLGPILDEPAWRGVEARRSAILAHVAAEQKRLGDSVYAW
jgi:hypothetical protein